MCGRVCVCVCEPGLLGALSRLWVKELPKAGQLAAVAALLAMVATLAPKLHSSHRGSSV